MKSVLSVLLLTILFLSSCTPEEGEGGKATIKGHIQKNLLHEKTGDTLGVYFSPEERVYITYGDNEFYNDDVRTDFNGYFEFDFLYKGDYKVSVYSECKSCEKGIVLQEYTITLDGNKSNYDLGVIQITEFTDKGATGVIKGKLQKVSLYNNDTLEVVPIKEERVYIQYENDDFYFEDVRTDLNGFFQFDKIFPGNYKVYSYEECLHSDSECVDGSKKKTISFGFNNLDTLDIGIINSINYSSNGGKSVLHGIIEKIRIINGDTSSLRYNLADERIYLQDDSKLFYSDDIRSDYNGEYYFDELFPGNYTVFAYSSCFTGSDCLGGKKVVKINITIPENGDTVHVKNLIVE